MHKVSWATLYFLSIVSAIAAVLLPTGASPAYACSCVGFSTEEYVEKADVIVVGKVQRLIKDKYDVDAVVAVERYLKGAGPADIEVDSPGGCGVFDDGSPLGQRYLLFLTGETSPFYSDICLGSGPLEGTAAQDYLRKVEAVTGPGFPSQPQDTGPGSPPLAGVSLAISQSGAGVPWLGIAIGSALGAAAIVTTSAFLLRRLRHSR